MRRIKIFGERNTGTNYLRNLVVKNIEETLIKDDIPNIKIIRKSELFHSIFFHLSKNKNLGWKHANIDQDFLSKKILNDGVSIILIVKNPYSFLLSLHKRPYHNKSKKKLSFSAFLSSEWKTRKRENLGKSVETPIDLWNEKTRSFLKLAEKHSSQVVIVKYEDLVTNPQKSIEDIANKLNLKLKPGEFKNYSKSTKNEGKSFSDYSEYYLSEKWKDKLSSDDILTINSKLDKDLMIKLGYTIL